MDKATFEMIFKMVAYFVFFLLSVYVVPWIKSKISAEKMAELEGYAEWAVRSAEQLYTEEEWLKKKTYAMEYVATKIGELGVEMSAVDIEALIESTVNFIKYGTEYNK